VADAAGPWLPTHNVVSDEPVITAALLADAPWWGKDKVAAAVTVPLESHCVRSSEPASL
jgi:hypothetical protein